MRGGSPDALFLRRAALLVATALQSANLAGRITSAIWRVIGILSRSTENHLLVPQIFERQVGLSAVSVIIAILTGGELLGIAGIILAVLSAAILQVIVEEFVPKERVPATSAGRR